MSCWVIGKDKPEDIIEAITGLSDSSEKPLVVCYDYFDTIVTRRVVPEYTKQIASTLLAQLLNGHFQGELIYNLRKEIELSLCEANARITGELEFSYEALGMDLFHKLRSIDNHGELPECSRFVRDMLDIEVTVEKKVQTVCPEVLQVLEDLWNRDFTQILVSDFYLPGNEFKDIIAWHKLEHFFSKVYVSSERQMSKGSGRIYPVICEELDVDPSQVLMIGDNLHADIKMAKQCGLLTMELRRTESRLPYKVLPRKYNHEPLSQFKDVSLPVRSMFPEMGISLWRFTHLLFEELNKGCVSNVFFFSKEGEFLKQLFEKYQLELFGEIKIQSHYLLVSRKSTFIASLASLDNESFSRLFDHYRDLSIKEFLQSLNFVHKDILLLIDILEKDCDQRLSDLRNQEVFRILLDLEQFQSVFNRRRLEQKRYFLDYLDSFDVDYRQNGLDLVDVGWKGSIQDNIYHILSGEVAARGYYIGLWNSTERVEGNTKKGLLFDNSITSTPYLNVYNNNRSLFEMVLGASHGSADYYKNTSHEIELEYPSVKNKTIISQNVATLDHDKERRLYQIHIKPLQEEMLDLHSELNLAYIIDRSLPSQKWFAKIHARMVYLPTQEEIKWFEALYHLENFGIFEFTNFETKHDFSLTERLRNLINIIKDSAVLETGVWPPVILRRFGVGHWQSVDGRRRYVKEFGTLPLKGLSLKH